MEALFTKLATDYGLAFAMLVIAFVAGSFGKWRWDREYNEMKDDRDFWRNDSQQKQEAVLDAVIAIKEMASSTKDTVTVIRELIAHETNK